jgi:hypothetical protein
MDEAEAFGRKDADVNSTSLPIEKGCLLAYIKKEYIEEYGMCPSYS